jgi:ADP-ribose pyrophosphatase YjhB (NUDIX family)
MFIYLEIHKVYRAKMSAKDLKELVLCHVIKSGGSLLLIKSADGMNKDKWNAPSGEIAQGEQRNKAAMRHVFQQTGIFVNKVMYHGTVRLFLNGANEATYLLHIYSTKFFSGDVKPNVQGEVKWFNFADIPYYEMWADDKYWINLMLQGKEFNADFFFDEKNEKILKYQINEKSKNIQKALPAIIVLAVLVVVAYSVFASGLLNSIKLPSLSSPKKPPPLVPTNTVNAITTSTTSVATTTVAPTTTTIPIKVEINNINEAYNYTGPNTESGVDCNYRSHVNIIPYGRYVNTQTFLMNISWQTGYCNLTITNMVIGTPGFRITSTEPALPTYIPGNSTEYLDYTVTINSNALQNNTYVGPLNIDIYDK